MCVQHVDACIACFCVYRVFLYVTGCVGQKDSLVQGDVWLLALGTQRQAALLKLGLRVVPVLVQNKLLLTHTHTESKTKK